MPGISRRICGENQLRVECVTGILDVEGRCVENVTAGNSAVLWVQIGACRHLEQLEEGQRTPVPLYVADMERKSVLFYCAGLAEIRLQEPVGRLLMKKFLGQP